MKVWGIRVAAATTLLAIAFMVGAAGMSPKSEQAQFSILLKGMVDIDADGHVERYLIDGSDKLASGVSGMLDKQISNWKFEPVQVHGKPVDVRTNMSVRLVATPDGEGNYGVGIQSVWFSGDSNNQPDGDGSQLSIRKRADLRYPYVGVRSGMGGTVYVALKIGPEGDVLDAIIEQVNLTTFGTDVEMAKARRVLGNNTLASLRKWTFNVPTQGDGAGKSYWIGVLTVHYAMEGTEARGEYGEWEKYVPGPHAEIPWQDPDGGPRMANGNGVDALPAGQLSQDNSGPKLLTPLTQG